MLGTCPKSTMPLLYTLALVFHAGQCTYTDKQAGECVIAMGSERCHGGSNDSTSWQRSDHNADKNSKVKYHRHMYRAFLLDWTEKWNYSAFPLKNIILKSLLWIKDGAQNNSISGPNPERMS